MKEITTNHPGKTSKKAPSEDQKKGVSGKDDTDEEDLPKIFTYDEIDRLLLAIGRRRGSHRLPPHALRRPEDL